MNMSTCKINHESLDVEETLCLEYICPRCLLGLFPIRMVYSRLDENERINRSQKTFWVKHKILHPSTPQSSSEVSEVVPEGPWGTEGRVARTSKERLTIPRPALR